MSLPKKVVAERQGFEPWEPRSSTVFKTAAFDHSATSPCHIYGVDPCAFPKLPRPMLQAKKRRKIQKFHFFATLAASLRDLPLPRQKLIV